ncbi:MAG: hypothetical protein AB7H90_03515 [Alphaproteobacteria bacterium]
MARKATACSIQARLANGVAVETNHSRPVDPVNASTVATTQAAVEDAVGVLEADAESPTEAHVDDLRTAWDLLVADIAAVPAYRDVVISYEATAVVNRDILRQVVNRLIDQLPYTL